MKNQLKIRKISWAEIKSKMSYNARKCLFMGNNEIVIVAVVRSNNKIKQLHYQFQLI